MNKDVQQAGEQLESFLHRDEQAKLKTTCEDQEERARKLFAEFKQAVEEKKSGIPCGYFDPEAGPECCEHVIEATAVLQAERDALRRRITKMELERRGSIENGTLHPSWREKSRNELLDALTFQGATTKALLKSEKEIWNRVYALREKVTDGADVLAAARSWRDWLKRQPYPERPEQVNALARAVDCMNEV